MCSRNPAEIPEISTTELTTASSDNASSEIKLICRKYSANVNNIYTCIRRAAFGT